MSERKQHHLSVTIITKNEEANIARCLESVTWADEIILVDSGSTDNTMDIAADYKCRIFQEDWQGFGKTKQRAVDYATHEWVLAIDADEQVTPELKAEIVHILSTEPEVNGYRIRRISYYLGKKIRFSGWHTDAPKRLFRKNKGRYSEDMVHESVQIEGKIKQISEALLHYTYPTIESHLEKMNRYTSMSAKTLFEQGKTATVFGAIARGKWKFIKMYVIQAGFLDGKTGFVLALNSAYGVFLKYVKLWKLNR